MSERAGSIPAYDANGNLVSDGSRTYVWDARDRLVRIKQGEKTILGAAYDPLDRRVRKSTDGTDEMAYIYDGINMISRSGTDGSELMINGLEIDEHLAAIRVGHERYFAVDGLSSTVALTDASGQVTSTYAYDPYGVVQSAGEDSESLLFTGRDRDLADLYFYRARYYMPVEGRFMTSDPLEFDSGQMNFYSYVDGDPLSYVDPLGLSHFGPGAHGPLDPNSQNLMQCMDACTHRDLCITSGNDGTHSGPNDPHLSGQAIDIGKNSNPGLSRNVMQQCFTQCTSLNPLGSYGQEEGNHYHLQTRPGRGGAHGFAPGVH